MNSHKIPGLPAFKINQYGQLDLDPAWVRKQKRKKFWRKVGNGIITGAAFAAGYSVANKINN